jgi:hypothetical protein
MRPRLIGLMGYAGAGKSSTAEIMVQDFNFHRMRFADTLKNMLMAFGLTKEQVDGDQKEIPCDLLGGKTPRWAMQTLGTEWGRQLIHPDLWVKATMLALSKRVEGDYVIDDVRFQNEADAIQRAGGEIWRVKRPGYPLDGSTIHASEVIQETIWADWTIHNNAGLADLCRTLHNMLWRDR